jgi:hypothetical protein
VGVAVGTDACTQDDSVLHTEAHDFKIISFPMIKGSLPPSSLSKSSLEGLRVLTARVGWARAGHCVSASWDQMVERLKSPLNPERSWLFQVKLLTSGEGKSI